MKPNYISSPCSSLLHAQHINGPLNTVYVML